MAVGALIPLVILFAVLGVAAFIGYSLYVWSGELADRASKKMEKSNMAFTKEGGLQVRVPQMQNESYEDRTQNVIVNIWNNASLPNYKSRLGWNSTQTPARPASGRPAPSPKASSTSSTLPSASSAAKRQSALSPPPHSSSQKRSSSPVPGGWS